MGFVQESMGDVYGTRGRQGCGPSEEHFHDGVHAQGGIQTQGHEEPSEYDGRGIPKGEDYSREIDQRTLGGTPRPDQIRNFQEP